MYERQFFLNSIAKTLEDYREGEIPKPDADHVDRWICQFDKDVQLPLLRELNYVLKRTYFSRMRVRAFFEELVWRKPCDYWRSAHFLNIQKNGHSQREIQHLFGEVLRKRCELDMKRCGAGGGDFIYLDDVLFTGNRIRSDLSAWIDNNAPSMSKVRIIVIAYHRLGEWQCKDLLVKHARKAGKKIELEILGEVPLENRKKHRDHSDVLWPAIIPDDANLKAYISGEKNYPFEPRKPGGKLNYLIFPSERGRQLLERELLLAGVRIRSFSKNPKEILRPLGFSRYGLGFGSMIITYRNCPNNVPLALWWGDPKAANSHPFSKWYPLVPRKTYP